MDDELPAARPLVLLADGDREAFNGLARRLPGRRDALLGAELNLKLTWTACQRRKGEVHEWLRVINVWTWGNFQGTDPMALVRRVPGRGQSYKIWRRAAENALGMWKNIEANPPPMPPGYDPGTPQGRSVGEFETVVRAFDAADGAIVTAEVELKIARGGMARAQEEATELLMAYGHGERARLGQKGALDAGHPAVVAQARGEDGSAAG